ASPTNKRWRAPQKEWWPVVTVDGVQKEQPSRPLNIATKSWSGAKWLTTAIYVITFPIHAPQHSKFRDTTPIQYG
ncbi:MAG: hypothetical protein ACKPKO_21060, partial [Candidatus Fonsibacter sp.]